MPGWVVILLALGLSYTRAAWVGFMVGLTILVLIQKPTRNIFNPKALIAILALLVQTPGLRERVEQGGLVGYTILGLGALAWSINELRGEVLVASCDKCRTRFEALAAYREAAELAPDRVTFLASVAVQLVNLDEREEAMEASLAEDASERE